MPRKRKTFVTDMGFFQLAVAAPTMKAALEAWGLTHNAFHSGFPKETHDAAIIAAAQAQPGVVLQRPLGSRAAFAQTSELPKVKLRARPKKAEPAFDAKALRAAEQALSRAAARHAKAMAGLQSQRDALDAKMTKADTLWQAQKEKLEKSVRRAKP